MFSLFSLGKVFFTLLLFSLQEFQRNLLVYSLLSFLSLVFKGCLNMIIFSVPHRSLRQILLSLPPILDMLFLLLFVILIFAMLGKLMIMRVIVLLFIQNISKLIVLLTSMMFPSSNKMCLFPSREDKTFSLKKCFSSFQCVLISSFCVFGESDFFQKEWFSLIIPVKECQATFLANPHVPWLSCAFMLSDDQQNVGFKIFN